MRDMGFIQSKNDPCLYHRPDDTVESEDGMGEINIGTGICVVDLQQYGYCKSKVRPKTYIRRALTAATHVDDIITRGHRKATEAFWAAVKLRFEVKGWDIVDYGNPITYCAKRISKVKKDGQVWYTLDQTEEIKEFLCDNGMDKARGQYAPMPDKHEISSDPAPVSEQEHRMYRSLVGSLNYFCETRFDIMYEVTRLAQGLAAPTKGHMKALHRAMAYLNTAHDMRMEVPRVVGDK